MTIVLYWGIAVGFVQHLGAQDAQRGRFVDDLDPLPVEISASGPFVRLPYITTTPARDPARDAFWETTVQSHPIDLSQAIPATRSETDHDPLLARDDDVPPLFRGIAASKPVILNPDDLVSKWRSENSRAKSEAIPASQFESAASPDWHVVGSDLAAASQRADETVRGALGMADKGAVYAAREEFESALRTIAQALDLHFHTRSHGDALTEGLLAMHEAGDFLPSSEHANISVDVAAIAAKHRSKALEGIDVQQLDSIGAARLHFAFAQQKLVAALGNSPAASRSLYGLGKFCMLRAEQSPMSTQANNARAMAFHQAAILVDKTNPVAGNELGVLLARQGRLSEARDVLRQSVAVHASSDTWRNLAIVHERLGEFDEAQRSRVECQRATELARNMNPQRITASTGTSVYWVDTKTFERGNMQRPTADPRPQPSSPPMYTRRPVQGIPWIR